MSQTSIGVSLAGLAALTLLATTSEAQVGTLTTVSGTVVDLSVDSSGNLLFCTGEKDVGTITTAGVVTVLADSASGPFPKLLRGVVETPSGDIAVVDTGGDIYELPGGLTPAIKEYSDLYLIQGVTDLIVDSAGNYVIASDTPSTGVRGVNWVSPDGVRWAYYIVANSPIALAADALNGDILMADQNGNGALRYIDTSNEAHATGPLDNTTLPGFSSNNLDGDIAVETDGSAWMIAGGTVYRHDRGTGITSTMESGLGQLRGIAIAASSGGVASASGWSVYLAEGNSPTSIREIGNAGAPASVTVPNLGTVPGRGNQVLFFSGQQVFEMTTDLNGDLLVGGHLWGTDYKLMRVDLPSGTLSTIADQADGISGRIEGIQVQRDGSILVAAKGGRVFRIEENPLSVTTHFNDDFGDIAAAKDMTVDRDGTIYIADRQGWNVGQVEMIDTLGTLSTLTPTNETRGIVPDPFSAQLLVTEWNAPGFGGSVGRMDPATGVITPLPKFDGMNYTNADSWGDGDLVVDVEGNVYTLSEDDWSVYRYSMKTQKKVRIGSGYLNHPSGLAIAKSRNPLPGDTGWSLYVAEFDWLWEIPNVPAPAPARLDRNSPPVGRLFGYLPGTAATARSVTTAPLDLGLVVTTSNAEIYFANRAQPAGLMQLVLSSADGLSGDLVATAPNAFGAPIVANSDGQMWAIRKIPQWVATPFYDDAADDLKNVQGIAFAGSGEFLILDQPTGAPGTKLWRLSGGRIELLGFANRGERMAIDPLTGDVFVTQQGNPVDGGGEILRVDAFQSPIAAGHWRGDGFQLYDIGEEGGGISFDATGDFYVGSENNGHVYKIDRTTGTRIEVSGNYTRPTSVQLGTGRSGGTGPMGTSLMVLDEGVVYEVPAASVPAPYDPPASPPGLAPPVELQVRGVVTPGSLVPVELVSPGHAGMFCGVYSSFNGKVPGVALSLLGDVTDTRVISQNFDAFLWNRVGNQFLFPGLLGVLDGSGSIPPSSGLLMPNDPFLMTYEGFLDLTYIVFNFQGAQNNIETLGGTAQMYIGN